MIIGNFTKTEQGFSGIIRTLTIAAEATFIPSEGGKEKAPDYRVSHHGGNIGAAWRETSNAGKSYLSVQLDDPSFTQPIRCALVKSDTPNTYNLVWERARKRRDGNAASTPAGEF